MVGSAYFSFGTFSTTIQPVVRYGITMSASLKGIMMDIDRLSAMRVNTDNNRKVWVAFNAAQGARHSANEHLVPEQFFNEPDSTTSSVNGISAVKALQIAASQGQKIFTITQDNINVVLPQLQHKTLIIEDIQNAVAAGKIVTISQKAVSQNGWTGMGYSIVDPSTGAGAYLISGAADGGVATITDSRGRGFSITALMPAFSGIDEQNVAVTGLTLTMAHVVKLSVIKINKFYECNREAVINLAIAMGIALIIATLVSLIEVGTVGVGTPVSVAITAMLLSIMPATASAAQNNLNGECSEKCLYATEENIRLVLAPTTELTAQRYSVSLPVIQRFVERFENGERPSDPIKMYENKIIVNGNHRFIMGKLCKYNPPRIEWDISPSDLAIAYPIKDIKIDLFDWGND